MPMHFIALELRMRDLILFTVDVPKQQKTCVEEHTKLSGRLSYYERSGAQ